MFVLSELIKTVVITVVSLSSIAITKNHKKAKGGRAS
jgi:hypothetical protein